MVVTGSWSFFLFEYGVYMVLFYYPQISSPRRFQTKVKICLEKRKESQDYAKVRSNPDIMDNQVKRGGMGSKNADVASSIKTSVRWV